MMRRNDAPTASHKALQTMCMLLLLLGVGAVFVYPLMPRRRHGSTVPNQALEQRSFTGSPRSMIMIM